jgi:hypothetical protein
MFRHVNMFHHVESKEDVYAAFQQHYHRDGRIIGFLDIALIAFSVVGYYASWWGEVWTWLVAFGLVGSRMCYFIDNSNRNWAMHVIDWIEEARK